ncbi:hypothetical protein [Neobacillus ginsengisoli]|uniref:Uncharacterized protein n=1 Tax=Neobacillus ginsengisoli TaxID=904295 RepID=A0ABT9Y070_9BACI|nr:hypothetical protein [Neobacillus ginsengisoli]MDQ0201228.1 hypothetical protein [Neobacillus ginsengisoli]
MKIEEQQQYCEDLLEWCNNIYYQWESMKPRFSKLFDLKSLEEWEESCGKLKMKLQDDIKADLDDYQTAKNLYEQWEQLDKEAHAYKEIDVESERWMKNEEQQHYRKDLLEWCNDIYHQWESMKPRYSKLLDLKSLEELEGAYRKLKEKLQDDVKADFGDFRTIESPYREAHADYQEEIEVESDNVMKIEEQQQYREDLLEWCNNIYYHWESMKPKFSNLFDIKSLEEWEGACRELKDKLQYDLESDFDDYQTAIKLYEQWEQLHREILAYQEETEV